MRFLVRVALLVLAIGLIGAAVGGAILSKQPIEQAAAETGPLKISALPVADRVAGASLIERSPFAPNRSAFARNAGPPMPEVEVKLAGIFKMGKDMRANLVIGGQSITVRKGDETPIGTIASIEVSAVVIEGATPRRLEMFKQ